jgi:lipoprotein-anchoring transpeptidase ErfK/SrfK
VQPPLSPPALQPRVPRQLVRDCLRLHVRPTRFLLAVDVAAQTMTLFERCNVLTPPGQFPRYRFRKTFRISSSRFGLGQKADTNHTPLGLHRIAEKVGGGLPVGTVFRSRKAVGLTWQGEPGAPIAHRILWLDGLDPGWNRGGEVDTHSRYVYIHGVGNELTLGRPASRGCVHLAAADLLPLFDALPGGTLVWVGERASC